MNFTQEGLTLIENFEGCRLQSYQDQNGFWTVGVGHKAKDVHPDMTITQVEANVLLRTDLHSTIALVTHALGDAQATDNQFTAMCCLTFNIGYGNFRSSTVLKCVLAQDFLQAADAFLLWNKGGLDISEGLVRRRMAERDLFLKA